jgi:hypothetical protein
VGDPKVIEGDLSTRGDGFVDFAFLNLRKLDLGLVHLAGREPDLVLGGFRGGLGIRLGSTTPDEQAQKQRAQGNARTE